MEQPGEMGMMDGVYCRVVKGTHAGKSGTVHDINTSKTGQVTITVMQDNGDRFKTLGRNVVAQKDYGRGSNTIKITRPDV